MTLGKLTFQPVAQHLDLVAEPTKLALTDNIIGNVEVSEIDQTLSDTAAFCEFYDVGAEVSANCVIVEAKRADKTWYAACVVLATTRADVNGIVRRQLDARKISFAPTDAAVSLTSMEYGGITPVGLPKDWQLLVDSRVASTPHVIIGSGIRKSKLLVPGNLFSELPQAIIMDIVKP